MSLSCRVEVCDRDLAADNVPKRKPERSHLTLGNLPRKKHIYYVILKTLKNPAGTRYKVRDNVECFFTRFINEGKATIRFIEPAYDLKIQGQSEQLKQFIKLVRRASEGKPIPKSSVFSAPSQVPPKEKTELTINNRKEIPQATGFPKGLRTLQINNAELDKIEGSILRLQNLVVLNVSDNKLKCLPPHLDLLQNLKELNVSKNSLGPANDWRWMSSKSIQERLVLLELSSNELKHLPSTLSKFKALRYLYLNNNELTLLPNGTGRLSSLRVLEARNNMIDYLPASFRFLKLESIDLCSNSSRLIYSESVIDHFVPHQKPTLIDMAATVVVANRQPFDSELLPQTLVDYLLEANYCVCGTPVFPSVTLSAVPFDLTHVANSVHCQTHPYSAQTKFIGITFCSPLCRTMAYYNNLLIVNVNF